MVVLDFVLCGVGKMKAMILENNVIQNIVIVDNLGGMFVEYVDGAEIGDEIVDGVLIKKPKPKVVPESITARQARLVLLQKELLDDVETLLSSNIAWQIEWDYASEIERSHPLIEAMRVNLNLTEDYIDDMFILGATI